MPFIDDIFIMDEIFSIEQHIENKTGIQIPNVSHWNSSHTFKNTMNQVLQLPRISLPWDYYYTYSISIEDRNKVLKSLGVHSKNINSVMCLLVQSSTIAIVNMINFLVQNKRKRLCILQPAYFSVAECCSMFSMEYGFENTQFENGIPQIPVEQILAGRYDCVWITSPIYCTSCYYSETQRNDIEKLKEAGLTIIFDESLSLPGREMVRFFPIDDKVFAIYSPHKSISINGLKFSAIVCSKEYDDFFEQWVDVFSGALSSSNRDAILHYISPNFLQDCLPTYQRYISETKAIVESVVKEFPFASTIANSRGHYINIFTNLQMSQNKDFYADIIQKSMASFIPGELNGFNSNNGLCFRVNLTGDALELHSAVGRILTNLKNSFT